MCGIPLAAGLRESERLDPPIFTPATKAETGHDENISFETMADTVGAERAAEARRMSLEIYSRARAHAEARGIILADTKFEFGVRDGRLVWIDEALTPDSSRFWPGDEYEPGRSQPASTSSSCATTSRRSTGTSSRRGPSSLRTSWPAPSRSTWRRTNASGGKPAEVGGPGHDPARDQGKGRAVKQQLDALVIEMVDKGILFSDAKREFEKRFIARVLQRHRGNLSRAAQDLRIHRNTLGRKVDEYKL